MTFARASRFRTLAALALTALAALAVAASLGARRRGPELPPILFAMRARVPGAALALGVGPAGRTLVAGGRLVVRESDGRFVALLPERLFYDVAHPSVSYDAKRIAFAAVTGPDSAWRIWSCNASGRDLQLVSPAARGVDPVALYGSAAASRFERFDDFDPCWLPDGRIAFASTRWPLLAQAGVPATNLWVVNEDGTGLARLTAERDGGEAPSVDPVTGRLLYARWFFNRWRASDDSAGVVSGLDGALPADTVNLWQSGSIDVGGGGLRLAGGDPRSRDGEQGYQPIVLPDPDTTFVAVVADRRDLMRSTRLGVWAYPGRFGPPRPLAGYGSGNGWSACAPSALPGGRILFAMDVAGTGNFDLYVVKPDGRDLAPITSDLQTLEIDPVAIVPRPAAPEARASVPPRAADVPPRTTVAEVLRGPRTARFECLNVFANAPVDAPWPAGVPAEPGTRVRFWAALPRPLAEGGDTLALVLDAPVPASGVVSAEVPGDVPMFQQLVGADGRVLRSAHGPAHVAGYNFTPPGGTATCVGCHAGHSARPVPADPTEAAWTNLAPGARVTASSEQRGDPGAPAAVDRRTVGEPSQVDWIAGGESGEWLRLEFPAPVEVREAVLYGMRGRSKEGGPIVVKRSELVLFSGGAEVRRVSVDHALSPDGTRVDLGGARLDAIEFRPLEVEGKFRGHPYPALAEIETIARLAAGTR